MATVVTSVTGTNTAGSASQSSAVGDLFLAIAFRDGNTTAPTVPAGWTTISAATGANTCALSIAYVRATAATTAINGTWTNATSVVIAQLRPVAGKVLSIGGTSALSGAASSSVITFAAVTATNGGNAISHFLGGCGHSSTNTTITTAPSGMTNITSVSDATDQAAMHWTSSAVASWSSQTASVGGTAANWRSVVQEIIEAPIGFISHSLNAYVASRVNCVVTAPAGILDNDILIAQTGSTVAITAPAGFTAFTGSPRTIGGAISNIWWKRAASESGSYTFTHATGGSVGAVYVYRGCLTSGSPIDVSSVAGTLGNTVTATGVTTTTDSDILFYLMGREATAGAINPPTGMAERLDTYIYLADVQLGAAGATGNKTQTLDSSQNWGVWLAALKPAAGGTNVTVSLTGAQASGQAGTVTATGTTGITVSLTGAQATTAAGSVCVTQVGVWDTGTWDCDTWAGADVAVALTGSQATGQAGTVTATGIRNVSTLLTGAQATGQAGTVTAAGVRNVSTVVTGAQATGQAGTVTASGIRNASTLATGAQATGQAGTVTVTAGTGVSTLLTGAQATAQAGSVTITAKQAVSFTLTGAQATAQAGGVAVAAGGAISVGVSGAQATAQAGTVTITANRTVSTLLTGAAATGQAGTVGVTATKTAATLLTGAQAATAAGLVSVTTSAAPDVGMVKVWTGSAWVEKPAKVWTGSAWAAKPVKHWSGSTWV